MTLLKDTPATRPAATSDNALRSLLVHVGGGPESSPRLQAAVELARKFDAMLVGVAAEMFQTLSDPYGMLGGEWVVALQKLVEDDLKRAEAAFQAQATGLRTEWLSVETSRRRPWRASPAAQT